MLCLGFELQREWLRLGSLCLEWKFGVFRWLVEGCDIATIWNVPA
jgi:hypothetical protein